MRRVLVSGYYGHHNSGDDALLAASVWGAHHVFGPELALGAVACRIPVFPGSATVTATLPQRQRFRGQERLMRVWYAARADSVLFGGGSVFHKAELLEAVDRMLKLSGRGPHLACGVSLGPFRSSQDERACARVLEKLRFIGLRDRESVELARSLAPNTESCLTFDLAAILCRIAPELKAPRARRGIGFALCDSEWAKGDRSADVRRRQRLAALLRRVARELGEEIVLIDFNGHPEIGDASLHAELAEALSGATVQVRHVEYDPRPLEVLRGVGSLRAIVAMRLHGAVFGYLTSTPTLILSYHPKCRGWAERIGLAPELIHESLGFDEAAVMSQLARMLRGDSPAPALPVTDAEALAVLNFPRLLEGRGPPSIHP